MMNKLPPFVRAILERALAWFKGLSKPARVFAVSSVLLVAAAVGYVSWKTNQHTYATLFSNLDREDAAAVVAKLKEMKVPYRVEGDGATIEVPENNVRELRLELAGAGLPRGGGVGFESFDKMRLGATEFEQRVLYRRALEGELSRTIDTIAAVQSSRVHLVLPERSVFVGRSEPSSASVVLKLRGGRTMGPSEVAGVVHLVTSAVSGLTPDKVSVLTTEGVVLHKPHTGNEEEGGSGEASTAARAMESGLEDRARQMLEKVLGPGHVDVRVSAELDMARIERTEDHYDPKNTILRSEQHSVERTQDVGNVAGVPGAETTAAGAAAAADGGAPATGSGPVRESSTRNFEVDRVSEKRISKGGGLKRLTVAVVLDEGKHPRSKEEVERITALVRSAVGADDKRGDVVTVDSVPFVEHEPEAPAPVAAPALKLPPQAMKYAPAAAGALLLILGVVALRIRKGMKKRAAAAAAKREAEAKATALVVAKEASGSVAPAAPPAPPIESLDEDELREHAHARAMRDPATAALVLRFWLGHGEGERGLDEQVEITNVGTRAA